MIKNRISSFCIYILLSYKAYTGIVLFCGSVFILLLSPQIAAQRTPPERSPEPKAKVTENNPEKKSIDETNTIFPQDHPIKKMKEIVVKGSSAVPLLSITEDAAAAPAGTTILEKKQLDRITFNTYGDIFRNQVGINVIQYNQGLVAYGFTVRGFDEGHGRNAAIYHDGMPLNVTGSQHTNGYADQSLVIPELLERVEITRGPFSVLAGNHAVGASVQFHTASTVPSQFKYQIDNFGRSRFVPMASFKLGPGNLVMALDALIGNGYTQQSNAKRVNFFSRYSMPLGEGEASIRVQSYVADANSPGYLDKARILSGEISRRSILNNGIGDAKTHQNIVLNYRSNDIEGASGWGSGWFASAYYAHDIRRRWTNFDLSLPPDSNDPLNRERDELHQVGLDVRKTTSFNIGGEIPSQFVTGFQFNREEIHASRRQTDSRRNGIIPNDLFLDVVSVNRKVHTDMQAFYNNLQVRPLSRIKLTAGFRYDWMQFRTKLNEQDDVFASAIDSGLPTAIKRSASQFSPKVGAVLSLYQSERHQAEVYGNIARGLKSPYSFSDFYSNVDGVSNPNIPRLSISSLWSYEYGLKAGANDGSYNFRIGFWNTLQDQESSRNPAGFVQSFQKTRRDGFDVEGSWNVLPSTRIFASFSQVKARIKNPLDASQVFIPLVPKHTVIFGVESVVHVAGNPLTLTLANNYVGRMPISTDNSLHTKSYHRYTLRAAYQLPRSLYNAVITANVIGYTRQFEEVAFDFGGGAIGVSPSPRVKGTFTIAIPF